MEFYFTFFIAPNMLLTTLDGVGSLHFNRDFSTQCRIASPFLQVK